MMTIECGVKLTGLGGANEGGGAFWAVGESPEPQLAVSSALPDSKDEFVSNLV